MNGQLRRDDVDRFFDYSLHVPTRTVFLGTECDGDMAEFFLKSMTILDRANQDAIIVVMNNIGGDWYHGMAIYDAIATSKCHVTINVFGHAMSMGSFILQAADERIMAPLSTQMIHYGTWHSDGTIRETRVWHQEMERINRQMETIYLAKIKQKKPRFSMAQMKKLLETDRYFDATESIAFGLADGVL